MEYKDYYQILGVPRDATPEQIKTAYRKLARKYHPDVSREPDAERRFKDINEAHEVLKDPEKRAAYDALGSGWRAGQEFRPPPHAGATQFEFSSADIDQFSEFFASLFGGSFRRRREEPQTQRPSMEPTARIRLSLDEAYHGVTRQLQLEMPEWTPDGQVRMHQRTLNVRIPAGVTHGQQIRLPGQGSLVGGEPTDLFLEIEIAPHPFFRVEKRDLHLTLPVAPWEAALGATVTAPTPGGAVSLKIPAQARSGQRLRLKGRGLPGNPPGDILVRLEIVNPPTVSEEQRAAWQRLAKTFAGFDPRAKLGG